MAQFLLLDQDRKAVNVMEWDGVTEFIMPDGAKSFVRYDGPFIQGGVFDGSEIIDPKSTPTESAQD